uniref:Secreted protein n=1 Tax=Schistosoma curassoni TaxID=6186 RepID=A0A183JT93_9TREM
MTINCNLQLIVCIFHLLVRSATLKVWSGCITCTSELPEAGNGCDRKNAFV